MIAMQYGGQPGARSGGSSGGGSLDLLWTNPSPTASFAAQTVALDLQNYTYILVVARKWGDTSEYKAYTVLKDDKYFSMDFGATDNNRNGRRRAKASDTGVEFGSTQYNNGTNNNYCVPVEIYGVKL